MKTLSAMGTGDRASDSLPVCADDEVAVLITIIAGTNLSHTLCGLADCQDRQT
jgi:hypothetical protein